MWLFHETLGRYLFLVRTSLVKQTQWINLLANQNSTFKMLSHFFPGLQLLMLMLISTHHFWMKRSCGSAFTSQSGKAKGISRSLFNLRLKLRHDLVRNRRLHVFLETTNVCVICFILTDWHMLRKHSLIRWAEYFNEMTLKAR